jgi:tetratricopeptide (TPR) repeat protein
MQLFELGANCFNANRRPEAAKLIEAGLAQNPYYRDALYNLANTYLAMQDKQHMLPVVQRLVAVDPSYPDNWRLMAAAHQLTAKQIDAELRPIAKDPKQQTRAAALRKQWKVANDSVLKYYNRFHEAPARLTVTAFQHAGLQHSLAGTIENLTDKPATYSLRVEFLDAKGNVVATQNGTVAVGAKATQTFRLEAKGEGIAAYRYAPIA